MADLKPKISIIGGGNVGMRYAYALIILGLVRELILVDKDQDKAMGEVLDLAHGAPYIPPVRIRAGELSDIAGSDIVVITAGKKSPPGVSRLQLLQDNVTLYRALIPDLVKHAPEAIFLVVSNPVDILSYVTYKLSGKPWQQIIGSGTVLDTARFRYLLSEQCAVDARNIHAYILGEHGDSEFPVWSQAYIGGARFQDYCPVCPRGADCNQEQEMKKIFAQVRDAANNIIVKKGETSYGIGLSLVRITEALLNHENAILPVSTLVDGHYDLRDLYLSLPSVVNSQGVREIMDLELNQIELQQLSDSASILRANLKTVGF